LIDATPRHTPYCMVLTTVPDEAQAETLARQIVSKGLGACVQMQAIKSFYVWKGEACAEPEWQLSIKTRKALYPRLEDFIRAHHAYEVPQIVQVPISGGSADYLQWVADGAVG
jgi:periplasmic divalent cation tolerance protein